MTILHLDEIDTKFNTFFTSNFTGLMLECCVLCFDSQNHCSGVSLKKDNDKSNEIKNDYLIHWNLSINQVLRNTHADANRTTDFGAMCLSLLLADKILKEEGVFIKK